MSNGNINKCMIVEEDIMTHHKSFAVDDVLNELNLVPLCGPRPGYGVASGTLPMSEKRPPFFPHMVILLVAAAAPSYVNPNAQDRAPTTPAQHQPLGTHKDD